MNIKGNPGSKERLLEMFHGVNKVSVNESYEDYTPEEESARSSFLDHEYSPEMIQAAKIKLKKETGVDGNDLSKDEFDVMMFDYENSIIKEELPVEEPKKWDENGSFEDKEGIMQWVDNEEENVASEVSADIENEVSLQNDNVPETGNGNEVFHGDLDDVPETGDEFDQLEGGLADESTVTEFDPLQISKGIEIEMEHTNDPKVALEITMDHLKEIPDYYSRLDTMEKEAEGDSIEMDVDSVPEDLQGHAEMLNNTDQDIQNTLLGYDSNTPNASKDKPEEENNLTIN